MCSTKNLRRFYEPWHLGQWFARRSWFGCLTCTWLEFSMAQGLYHQKSSGFVSWRCWKILKHFQIMLYLKLTKCPVDDPLPATFTARLFWKNPPPESWLWAAWKSWNCKWQQLPQVENTTEWRHFFCHIILVGHYYYICLQDFRGTYLEPQFFWYSFTPPAKLSAVTPHFDTFSGVAWPRRWRRTEALKGATFWTSVRIIPGSCLLGWPFQVKPK